MHHPPVATGYVTNIVTYVLPIHPVATVDGQMQPYCLHWKLQWMVDA